MNFLTKTKFLIVVLAFILQYVAVHAPLVHAYANPATVTLGTVIDFAALATTAITSPTGPTVLNDGDLGIASPGTCTDFPSPCSAPNVNGSITNGAIQFQNTAATTGQTDATAAVADIGGRSSDETLLSQLGGQTLTQGVYTVPADTTNLTGDLTLSGDADSVFIFHLTSTFITDTGSRVLLTGGAQACNVFWKVDSSATFNGTTTMVGTVLAAVSVTFPGGGATVDGRVIAQTAAITFNNTTINNSTCASPSPTPTATPTPTPTASSSSSSGSSNSSSSSSSSSVCPLNNYDTPIIIDSKRLDPTSVYLAWGPYSGTESFNVRYGLESGEWLYNLDVTGFSTDINALPANQPIWVQVAARNNCAIATYGEARLVGGPILPSTGFAPKPKNFVWLFITSLLTKLDEVIWKSPHTPQ